MNLFLMENFMIRLLHVLSLLITLTHAFSQASASTDVPRHSFTKKPLTSIQVAIDSEKKAMDKAEFEQTQRIRKLLLDSYQVKTNEELFLRVMAERDQVMSTPMPPLMREMANMVESNPIRTAFGREGGIDVVSAVPAGAYLHVIVKFRGADCGGLIMEEVIFDANEQGRLAYSKANKEKVRSMSTKCSGI